MKTYFLERCAGGAKNVNFWKTVKPFFSKKCNSGDQNIILCEDNNIINDTYEVSEKFNTFKISYELILQKKFTESIIIIMLSVNFFCK